MITLKEAKNYLRVDYEEDDSLIQNLLSTAKNLVMDVGRLDEENFTKNEDTVRTAMLFALGYLYENRSNPDYKKLTLNLRSILFALGFQGFLILICVAIYAVLLQNVAISGDAINSIWSIVGYTVLLCFTLFKTGSVARSILGAH